MEANLCLFCTTPCGPSTFTFVDGQLIRIKNDKPGGREGRRGGDPTHDDYDDCNFLNEESSSLLSEQLKVIFILKKILGIKEEKLLSFLGKLDGHLLPEFWFQVCTSCREAVRNCFEIFKKISFLQKRFATISAELIGNIKKTSEKHEKINVSNKNYEELLALSIWKEIRETVPSVAQIQCYKFGKGKQTYYQCALGCPAEYTNMETMRRHIKLHSQKPEDAFPCELCGWIIGGVRGKQLAIDYHNFFIHHIGSNPIKSRGKNKRQRSPSPPLRPPKRPRARVTHPKVFKKKKPPSTSSSSRKLKTKTGNPTIVLVNGVVKNVPVEVQIVDVDPVAVVHNENYPDNDEKEIEQERFFSCDLNPGNVNDEDEYHDDEDVDEPEIKIIKIEDADDDDDYLPTERESQNEGEGNDLDFIPGNIASNPCSYTPIVTESLSGNAVKHYKCLMGCPAQFNKEFKLENHHKLHSPVAKASTCEICGWLVSPSFLKDHMTLNHPFAVKKDLIVKDNEEYTELITVRAGFSRYKCKRCPLHFNHMNQLIPHLELHKPGSGAVRCDICEWVMAPDKLKLHNQNHHPPKKKDRWELRAGPSGVGKPQVEN